MMTNPPKKPRNNIFTQGFRSFILIWLGQVVSLTGSSMTGFALGVWVFQETGSVTQFALISLSSTLPSIIFSPFAGALVDRWNRRTAMILSDAGSALCTLAIALLLLGGRLEIWHLYIILAVSSLFNSFQWPAYSSSITLLVPKKQFGRASGMMEIADSIAGIGAPLLAGTLMGFLPVHSIMLIDILTFMFALLTLIIIRIPQPDLSRESREVRGSLLREAAFGWKFISARPGLLGLLIFFASTNFFFSIAQVLFTPMVLSFTTPSTLGVIMSTAGFGMLAGSLFMSIWGGPKRKIMGILGFGLLQALVSSAAGVTVNVTFISTMVFLVFFNNPVINACSQAIWQSKTTPDIQGRVFSVRRMIAWGTIPLANLIAGPLADKVFEPWMAVDGLLADSIGRVLGVGPGRGIGLLYILLGIFNMFSTLILAFYSPTRHVETMLPDAVPDDHVLLT